LANDGFAAHGKRIEIMMFKKTLLAASVAAAAILGAGAASAQDAPMQGAPMQVTGHHHGHHKHHMGAARLIREEMQAGRLNQKEGALILKKLHEMHAERRAERQQSQSAQQGDYGQQGR
jgi:hypothetical protein